MTTTVVWEKGIKIQLKKIKFRALQKRSFAKCEKRQVQINKNIVDVTAERGLAGHRQQNGGVLLVVPEGEMKALLSKRSRCKCSRTVVWR